MRDSKQAASSLTSDQDPAINRVRAGAPPGGIIPSAPGLSVRPTRRYGSFAWAFCLQGCPQVVSIKHRSTSPDRSIRQSDTAASLPSSIYSRFPVITSYLIVLSPKSIPHLLRIPMCTLSYPLKSTRFPVSWRGVSV